MDPNCQRCRHLLSAAMDGDTNPTEDNFIRQHLATSGMRIVVIARDPKPFQDAVAKNTPSPLVYNSPKPKEITDEDAVIQSYRIDVKPQDVAVVPVQRVFE